MNNQVKVAVLISADVEWRVVREIFPDVEIHKSPFGEWFTTGQIPSDQGQASWQVPVELQPFIFFQGGWGKIAAAASTQYVIDQWHPNILVNLGTCGGFDGDIDRGTIILVEHTVVYDIIEQMGDNDEHIAHYATDIDLSWLSEPYPTEIRRAHLISGDRDLVVEDIPWLKSQYGAIAGDWESGAIAWVASRNHTRLLILRGVTDLVGSQGGEAYGNLELFINNARSILRRLISELPLWLVTSVVESNDLPK
jgi:adenosylhomocysteine nucleosidase